LALTIGRLLVKSMQPETDLPVPIPCFVLD
jgi:hypothetical protein